MMSEPFGNPWAMAEWRDWRLLKMENGVIWNEEAGLLANLPLYEESSIGSR